MLIHSSPIFILLTCSMQMCSISVDPNQMDLSQPSSSRFRVFSKIDISRLNGISVMYVIINEYIEDLT